MVATGLAFVYLARTQSFADEQRKLDRGEIMNLNSVTDPAPLVPFVQQQDVAERVAAYIARARPLANISGLRASTVPRTAKRASFRWRS